MESSPFSTPKRKHSEMLSDSHLQLEPTTQFTFTVKSALDDRGVSPWTRVTHKFRDLALGSGGGGSGSSADPGSTDLAEESPRKRLKLPEVEMVDAENVAAQPSTSISTSPLQSGVAQCDKGRCPKRRSPTRTVSFALDEAVVEQTETMANTKVNLDESGESVDKNETDRNNHDATPSITTSNLPSTTSKSQPCKSSFKRSGTPPFESAHKPPGGSKSTTPSPTIVDPVRAALTWREEEITIYDPDDSDDDGTGINGIGFKPTPAIAYARALRRRQQLDEYRRREEREARAKRNMLRRRGGSPASVGSVDSVVKAKAKNDRRRVRFLEGVVERAMEGGGVVKMTVVGGEVGA
ncbi:hypothetical protein VTJ49DRAFT_5302 [Mycothermus thermophilus]|uniref:Uncharacterized protein n=1 Tax=Humicola insolens TaxID=85995 RepID=A0ABR3V3N4_HUMIN